MFNRDEDVLIRNEDILSVSFDGNTITIDAFKAIPIRNKEILKEIKKELPKKYIINKNAIILFWKDGTKTIIKRNKEDKHDKKLGFLIAFFQKYSGLSKNQANKYLDNLIDKEEQNNEVI